MKKIFASYLLRVGAVKLNPEKPFIWASGWKSPIYCDNRQLLSYPEIRTFVRDSLSSLCKEFFPEAEAIAGVATGAIAQGALVAEALNLPFAYVRPKPKDHGMQNLIEGRLEKGKRVVVVEDLISTGGSSLKAVEAIRNNGNEILGMVASFTYGFPQAAAAFEQNMVKLHTISDYEAVLEEAMLSGQIRNEDLETLQLWRKNPEAWGR